MVNEITVEYGYTKNMGNYESERLSASVRVAIDDNHVDNILKYHLDNLKSFVHEQLGITKNGEPEYGLKDSGMPTRRRPK